MLIQKIYLVLNGLASIALAICIPITCNGTAAHFIDVAALVETSDLIVTGRVTSLNEQGPATIELPGGAIPGKAFSAVLKADHSLKGTVQSPFVSFGLFIPDSPSAFQRVRNGQYGIFFLQQGTSGYKASDPTYLFLPAAPNAHQSDGSPIDRVVAELAQVLTYDQSAEAQTFAALDALATIQVKSATETLRKALQTGSGDLQLRIASKLLARNDITGLATVERALLNPAESHGYLLPYLAGSLGGLKDPRSVPALKRLLETNDPHIVKGAAIALRQSGSPHALEPLSHLLTNSDQQVRYYAVVGLGEITKQNEWTPAFEEFHGREAYYLSYWRTWTESNLPRANP